MFPNSRPYAQFTNKICVVCGVEFPQPRNSHPVTCGPKCSMQHDRDRREARRVKRPPQPPA